MNANPLISVIVPNYNHALYLQQRLDTVFGQSYENIEVLILDDHSTDNSLAVIGNYRLHPKLAQIVVNEVNGGTSIRQWKKGIEMAKGEWIWIAESDDFSNPDFLRTMMHFAIEHPQCGLIYCQTSDVDSSGNRVGDRLNYTGNFANNIWKQDFECEAEPFIRSYLKVKNVIPNASAVIFRRTLVDFDTDFGGGILCMRYAADWLFWMRLIRKTKIGFVAATLNFFRDHNASTRIHDSRKKLLQRLREEIRIRRQLFDLYPGIVQDDEWELIYSRWFSIFRNLPLLNPAFYFARCPKQSLRKFLSKKKQFELSGKIRRTSAISE